MPASCYQNLDILIGADAENSKPYMRARKVWSSNRRLERQGLREPDNFFRMVRRQ